MLKMFLRPTYQWRYSNIFNIMLLAVSPSINNTLCYIICWHVFVRNIVTSYMQNYYIRCIILYNRLDISFHLPDSSSYKWSKSGIAFLQTGLNSLLLMSFTKLAPNTYAFWPKRIASLYLVDPGIRSLLSSETPIVSLSGN